jgi:hypothetical protein
MPRPAQGGKAPAKSRRYLGEYMRWLRPHRYSAGALLLLVLSGAGLQMVEPLFMRYIADRVPLKRSLDGAARLARLNMASGDVVVWGGATRLAYHGIAPLKDGEHPPTGRCRINLTFGPRPAPPSDFAGRGRPARTRGPPH